MGKLIMWNIITLDGYFEGTKSWDLPFHEAVWGPELERLSIAQLKSAAYLVFGRVTFEGMAAYWKDAKGEIADLMNSIPKIVCSRTIKTADWTNSTLVQKDIVAELRRLKSVADKDMYVFGSANLSETLMRENLFDEYRIGIAPVLLGNGKRLFPVSMGTKKLSLLSSQPLANGGIVLKYRP